MPMLSFNVWKGTGIAKGDVNLCSAFYSEFRPCGPDRTWLIGKLTLVHVILQSITEGHLLVASNVSRAVVEKKNI